MKKLLFYFFLTCLLIGIISCSSEPTRQAMEINIKEATDKTILPQDTSVDVVKYKIEGIGPDNSKIAFETSRTSYTLDGMLIGSWSLTAYGVNREGINLVKGETTFNLSPSNTKATIVLDKLVGSGELDLTFQWDSSKIVNPILKLNLTDYMGRKTELQPENLDKDKGRASLYKTDLASGSYIIQAELFDSDVKFAGFSEAIRIVDTKTTQKIINMLVVENDSDDGSITLVNQAGSPVKCTITGLESTVIANEEVCVKLTPTNTSLNEVHATWYLDGEKIGTGTQLTFKPKAGSHRLDVVAETPKLGSAGSAFIIFQADVLGDIGEPVKNDISINSNVNLGGDSVIEISEQNKLFISSTRAKTLQICSVKNNILSADTTYNDGRHNFSTADIKEMLYIPSLQQLYLINTVDDSVSALNYNSSTDVLNKVVDLEGVYISNPKTYGNSFTNLIYNKSINVVHAMCDIVLGKHTYGLVVLDPNATTASDFLFSQRVMSLININHPGPFSQSPDGTKLLFSDPVSGTLGFGSADWASSQNIFTIYSIDVDSSLIKELTAISYLDNNHILVAKSDMLTILEKNKDYPIIEGVYEHYIWNEIKTFSHKDGYDPIAIIPNYDTGYIYLINKGSNNITTFQNNGSNISHLYTTELGFIPKSAKLSEDGQMLVVQEESTNKPYIFKIKQ